MKLFLNLLLCVSIILATFLFGNVKNASAAPGCTVTDNTRSQGESVPITYGEIPAGQRIAFFGELNVANAGTTQESTTALVSQNVGTIPFPTADGTKFFVVIEYPQNSLITCTGGPVTVGAASGGSGGSGSNNSSGTVECNDFLSCVKDGITNPSNRESSTFVGRLISDILPLAIAFGGFIAIVMIVISGIQFVTSSGDPNAAGAARGRLTFALIGFALLVLAFMITKLIDAVFLRNSGIFG